MDGERDRESTERSPAGGEAPFLSGFEDGKEIARLDDGLAGGAEHERSIGRLFDQLHLRATYVPKHGREGPWWGGAQHDSGQPQAGCPAGVSAGSRADRGHTVASGVRLRRGEVWIPPAAQAELGNAGA
jgi:hypothetical protein